MRLPCAAGLIFVACPCVPGFLLPLPAYDVGQQGTLFARQGYRAVRCDHTFCILPFLLCSSVKRVLEKQTEVCRIEIMFGVFGVDQVCGHALNEGTRGNGDSVVRWWQDIRRR